MTRARLRPGLAVLAAALVWAFSADGLAQRPPPGSPDAAFAERTLTPAVSGVVRDAVAGRPLAGAVVSLGRSVSNAVGRQVTDDTGRFLFTNLQTLTTYELTASRPGYFDGAYGITTAGGAPHPIRLTASQWLSDADILMLPPSALSGRVTGEDDAPVAGVRVTLSAPAVIAGTTLWVRAAATSTDDDGRYRIAALPPGEYMVVVPSVPMTVPADAPSVDRSKPSIDLLALGAGGARYALRPDAIAVGGSHLLVDEEQPPVLLARMEDRARGYGTTSSSSVVSLGAGEERSAVDIRLRPVALFTISGLVEAAPGVNRRVKLLLMPRGREHLGLDHEAAIAAADAHGRFTFLNVPAGAYTILAGGSIGGYMDPLLGAGAGMIGRVGAIGTGMPSGIMLRNWPGAIPTPRATLEPAFGRLPVNVANADVAGLAIPLEPGVSIRGILVREGPLPDWASSPDLAEEMRTVIAEPAGGEPILGRPSGLASGDGESQPFAIGGVMPGDYLLRAAGTVKSVIWNGRDYADTPLPVPRTGLSGVVITVVSQTATLTGTIRDAQGEPVSSALIVSFPTDPALWQRNGVSPLRFRTGSILGASRDGTYALTGMPAGEYFVLAVSQPLPRTWRDPAFLAKAAAVATRVRVEWGGKQTQHLMLAAVPR